MNKTKLKDTVWTPLFDNVLDECGITTAAVFGRVWRYCQMDRGFCHAEQETIAYQLGINRKTVNLALGTLVRLGYLSDTTPNRKGRARIYFDTGKAGNKSYEDVTLPVTEPVTEGVTLPVTEPVTKSNTKIDKTEKKKKTTTTQSSAVVADLDSLNAEQKEAYQLAKQVSSHETALSKAMSETPMESAIGLLEWHVEHETPNSRVAATLLNRISGKAKREKSIDDFPRNLERSQHWFVNLVSVDPTVTDAEIKEWWFEYIGSLNSFYPEKDKYDVFADSLKTVGIDNKSHIDRMKEFVERKSRQKDERPAEIERAEQEASYL